MNIGLLGELQVEQRLVEQGWHPLRLDTAQMASNADLVAINKKSRVAIQVKTTNTGTQRKNAHWLTFGYSTAFLTKQEPFFNAKESPLLADVVVAVSCCLPEFRFVVLPVALAEALCRLHATYWASIQTKAGKARVKTFPVYLCFTANRKTHADHHNRIKRNLIAYENRWDILGESLDKLHDRKAWAILK